MKRINNINSIIGSVLVVITMLLMMTSTSSATWGNYSNYNNHKKSYNNYYNYYKGFKGSYSSKDSKGSDGSNGSSDCSHYKKLADKYLKIYYQCYNYKYYKKYLYNMEKYKKCQAQTPVGCHKYKALANKYLAAYYNCGYYCYYQYYCYYINLYKKCIANMNPVGSVCGLVFEDVNKNNSYDKYSDRPLSKVKIKITDSKGKVTYTSTGNSGYYSAKEIAVGSAVVKIVTSTLANSQKAKLVVGTDPTSVNIRKNCEVWEECNGYTFGAKPLIATLTNDSNNEGNNLTHIVKMTSSSPVEESYVFALTDITTTSADYGTPMFTQGVTYDVNTGKITVPENVERFYIIVPSNIDNIFEGNESYTIKVSTKTATGTIIDTDIQPNIGSVSNATALEGTLLTHIVMLQNISINDEVYDFKIEGITATEGQDYTVPVTFTNGVSYDSATGKIKVPAGVTTFNILVATTRDDFYEGKETYKIMVADKTATGTILDNDGEPTVSITGPNGGNATVIEGQDLVFTVGLSNPSAEDVVIDLNTADGSAGNPEDYTEKIETVTIPAGSTSVSFTVSTIDDLIDENNETMTLNGAVTSGNTSNTATVGTGTILDNDGEPTVSITGPNGGNATVIEGQDLVFTVGLSNPSAEDVVIDLNTADGSAGNPEDYTEKIETVTIPAGSTSVSFTVSTIDDLIDENNETMTLNGAVTSGNTSNTATVGTGTILDNDGAVKVASVTSDSVVEGNTLVHTVTMTGLSAKDEIYYFTHDPATATADDYITAVFSDGVILNSTGTITVPSGLMSFSISVKTIDDTKYEASETYNLTVGEQQATGTIRDIAPHALLRDDTRTIDPEETITFSIINNDKEVIPNTIFLHKPLGVEAIEEDIDGDGNIDKITVKDEGVWSVDNSGNVTFVPSPLVNSLNLPAPITYTVNGYTEEIASVIIVINDN